MRYGRWSWYDSVGTGCLYFCFLLHCSLAAKRTSYFPLPFRVQGFTEFGCFPAAKRTWRILLPFRGSHKQKMVATNRKRQTTNGKHAAGTKKQQTPNGKHAAGTKKQQTSS